MVNFPYDPSRYKRSNVYVAEGRLRPLAVLLLTRQLRRLHGRSTRQRPLGWRDWWPSLARHSIPRNGHQARREQEISLALRALRRATTG